MVGVTETIAAARSRRPFTILGILIGLLVLGSFIFVANNAGSGTTILSTPGSVKVVVAKNPIRARTAIQASDLQETTLAAMPVRGFGHISDLALDSRSPKYALIDIPAGQPLVANAIASFQSDASTAAPPYLDIPQGYIALTIPTSEQQGVAGYIQAGDFIGVLATLDQSGQTISKTIFTNIKVLELGAATYDQGGRLLPRTSTSGASLTVLLTQCDAEYLSWFLARASLRYVLESHADYRTTIPASTCPIDQTKGVTSADIAARFGIK